MTGGAETSRADAAMERLDAWVRIEQGGRHYQPYANPSALKDDIRSVLAVARDAEQRAAELGERKREVEELAALRYSRILHVQSDRDVWRERAEQRGEALRRIARGVCSGVMAGFEECDRQRTWDDFCTACRARAALRDTGEPGGGGAK